MKVNHAEIVISAVSKKQYPEDHLPEIALAGRSNVGKSSFINRLINRKNLARTSSKPGKTQTLNFYRINESFYFVDVPGYGYAKVSKKEREKWGRMMEEYFQTRDTLKAVVLVTDLRHDPTQDDIQMYDFIKYYDLPVIIIGTKLDKITKNKRKKHINRSKQVLDIDETDIFIPFSAEIGEGKDEAWSALSQYLRG
ncbi:MULTISPECIES: ribosome biogenesis GTP-binding protein YihA/YsxC [Oceanobacillus]|uniref:Probable GTP-binding protein EngB n=1 Tax=Oceanobacillus kimchii TaxID=746691 RepID=A0ABQ5TLY0_9BACI|nr:MULTISPECIES: ribosome biogenesis GTP-binding protein YihA/YsxC [Oceanobacillus]MBT2598170.1 YihA family ribosome biogenesis GTP-binding protein [Oceanobacillus sp. ISL-74]MBT2651089.1 YihA family ribosome biogenesis GTP-binding protein [Oceanobacillus sp. ISL-73]MCT1575753.1 ribosome biogenesis GTP-binding protein YihA/YsxC [Oceanobacillus kimchii]MCT2135390.1 ribosome biogenesis GTP-binding protein YihA/YsxC [Oceanobacillus kimchii]OEH55497.1 GTP-binding protein [Oceanobacillus sp. E9]